MKHLIARVALPVLVVIAGSAGVAQTTQSLPVPGVDPARDVPGARLLPDPKTTYRVRFDMASAPAKPGDVNPILQTAARYVNTLAKAGVQADHRKIAVIIHQGATPSILKSEAYKARN